MKIKCNFTIDEEMINKINEFPNKSEKVNEILTAFFNSVPDVYEELHKALEEKDTAQKKISQLVPQIEQLWEDGDKKQREKAAKELEEFKEKQVYKEQNETLTNLLKEAGLFEGLLSCKDVNEVLLLNRKLLDLGIKNPYSKMGWFGAFLLKELAEYHNVFISLIPKELKVEKEKEDE